MDWEQLSPTTHRAYDPLADRVLILKTGPVETLRSEVALSLSMQHPAFRQPAGWRGTAALFEYVDGHPLDTYPSREEDRSRWAIGLLRALVRLHTGGMAHGDLKPSNVLARAGAHPICLIDLAMARPFGDKPVGGTPGFLAPELVAGGPLSVASDLYGFGRTVLALHPTGSLLALAQACVALDPSARPASAGSCLAMLGESPRPLDRGRQPELARVERSESDPRAQVWVGPCPPQMPYAIAAPFWGKGQPTVNVVFGNNLPIIELCDRYGCTNGTLSERAAHAIGRVEGPVIVSGRREVDEDASAALIAMVRAALTLGKTLVVLDASESLGRKLALAGAQARDAPRLDARGLRELASAYGVHLDETSLLDALCRTDGGPALYPFVARIAHDPTLGVEELLGVEERVRVSGAEGAPASLPAGSAGGAGLEQAVTAGAGHRAMRIVDTLTSAQQQESAAWVAQAFGLLGRWAEAVAIAVVEPEAQTRRAEWLLRLGEFDAADQAALQVLDHSAPPLVHVEALRIRALAARDAGRLDEARGHAAQAAAKAASVEGRRGDQARSAALLVEADIATAQGTADDALEIADWALASATDAHARAQAQSRRGNAFAACGQWAQAEQAYAAATHHAVEAGDIFGLPTFVMNCATSAHALGHFKSAIHGYERAAGLAHTTGRSVTVAAATTNLAALYVSLDAFVDARAVLSRAREACERIGYAIYDAQCDLIGAETWRSENRSKAFSLAFSALSKFRAIDAKRQAIETVLLINEMWVDGPSPHESLPPLDETALRSAGLGARLTLLQARRAAHDGAWHVARELAIRIHESAADPLVRLKAGESLVHALRGLTDPAAAKVEREVQAEREAVAATLPPGLRRRFLPAITASSKGGLGQAARRLVAIARRVLMEIDEQKVFTAALDEAVTITGAERAFLLKQDAKGSFSVLAARNLDREGVRRSGERFSRSIVARVFESGETMVTAQADEDPSLVGVRSVHEMGLRSVLCVPVFGPRSITAALYLDHRFAAAAFGPDEREWLTALSDIVGLGLENARLHNAAKKHAADLAAEAVDTRRWSELQAAQIVELESALRTSTLPVGGEILGRSPGILRAIQLASRVAPSMLPVLIDGESGVGKELFARLVHRRSPRARKPLVAINCGALTETLLESELFGHVRGAFTGAVSPNPGLFRSAEGGTLFLDEIGEMPLRMQARLLRVLQESEVRPVGGNKNIRVDVRIVAATNRNLADEIAAGRFREDLYYRLAGVQISIPPLRQRPEDLADLIAGMMEKEAGKGPLLALSRSAMRALLTYRFPGNVRELEQLLKRAQLIATGDLIQPHDLFTPTQTPTVVSRQLAHAQLDRKLIERALLDAAGNKSKAARRLGISRVTLYRWIKRYSL